MRLPFGLDVKTIIVTLLFVFFVLPWVMGFINRQRGNGNQNG